MAKSQSTEQFPIMMTKAEALCLIQGAVKGNIIYGSAASKDGQMTLRLAERFCNELGIEIK
jgi:hypothetical protein